MGPGGGIGAAGATGAALPSGGLAGPALALTSAMKGPHANTAVTSEVSPVIAHRTSRAPCARATRSARAQATA
ncbi:hypothetical protein, partial [Streptomyces thermoalcalitolerans]|uniref:hypothetical protein n=1 Tax=Streptomyces thermoalcalitolerans TaxID=65605 RepID=UPI003CD05BAF